ncbi:hypothetical protein ACTOJ1_001445 [Shigella flexneri]
MNTHVGVLSAEKNVEAIDVLFNKIDSLGGFFDFSFLSNKLNISEDDIKQEIKDGKLISINRNGAELIPSFQFSAFKKLPYLEDVLLQMSDVDNISKTVFLISDIDILDDYPAHILKKSPSEDAVNVILRKASLLNSK